MKKIIILLSLIGFFTSCKKHENKPENIAFNKILKSYFEVTLELNPINATSLGYNRFNNQFPNFLSDAYIKKSKAFYTKYKEKISKFSDVDLSPEQQNSKAILQWECNINLETLKFKQYETPIDQMWSINLFMGQLASGKSAQPFKTVKDYNNWLQRIDGYLLWMHTAKARMKEGINDGNVLPKSLIVKVLPQLKALLTSNIKDNLFYSPINNFPNDFSKKDKQQLTKAYTDMIANKLIPAYQNLYDFMQTDYLKAGRTTSGIEYIPNGKAYYQHQIKLYTTTNMTADEIHKLGLSEVKRITAEMEKVKTQVGYKGNLISFFDFVRNDKKLMPYTTAKQVLDHFETIHKTMIPQLNKLFDVKPKTTFKIRETEKFREKSASAEYNPGSLDGTRPGIFYVPVPNPKTYNVYSDESLFLHEAIPGHHYQISLQQENKNLPYFRKSLFYSAFGEGWALYCESLGKELGLYTNPFQYFGMLSQEMHRAIRLVVDTGMHAKGWTREQAIQYSLDHEADSKASITAEIERYMANPGQALSYKIGQLKIRELRAKAEKELGASFNIAKFHDQILESGNMPLALLEKKINAWIANHKK